MVVKLWLNDLMRHVGGAFNPDSVTFTLDGNSIRDIPATTIRVPLTSYTVWANFLYRPASDLPLGPHTFDFAHLEAL